MRKRARIVTITFDTKVYSKSKGFQFPVPYARGLGWVRGKPFSVALQITKFSSGEPVFRGTVPFSSGSEITSRAVFRRLEIGDAIRVTATRGTRKSY